MSQNEHSKEEHVTNETSALDSADEHIQLAVELIYLLESNNVAVETAVKALNIVKADFEKKLTIC